MTERTAYFIAAGRSLEAATKALAEWTAAVDRMNALCERVGASHPVRRGKVVSGFAFVGKEVPDGWRDIGGIEMEERGVRVYAPKRTTKAGRALLEEMAAAGFDGHAALNVALGLHASGVMSAVGLGFSLRSATAEIIDGKCVIGIPLVDGKLPGEPPPDAVPLKLSEYYALKEAAAEKAA